MIEHMWVLIGASIPPVPASRVIIYIIDSFNLLDNIVTPDIFEAFWINSKGYVYILK